MTETSQPARGQRARPTFSFRPAQGWEIELHSLPPQAVLDKLDLDRPGLEAVRAAMAQGQDAALTALLDYYRRRYPRQETAPDAPFATPGQNSRWARPAPQQDVDKVIATADNLVNHVFQWGPYPPADYGPEIDWAWDPAGDIEWVAAVYRFYWAQPLATAYAATGDERYARTFVELTTDWIAKHPLEEHRRTHPVYTYWEGFAWLDLQTGIRATQLCNAFRTLVHAQAFTPEFLAIFLASLYDHQVKTAQIPMGKVHNKAVFEQRGFVNVAYTFPEFKEARQWLELGLERTREVYLAQCTGDGVQREWCGGYHLAVLQDAVEIAGRLDAMGIPVPPDYREMIRKNYDYLFGMATPELGFPMFGDTARPRVDWSDRSSWPLYSALLQASEVLGDPKYAALARLERTQLPPPQSFAFREAGMYALRNDWGPEQVYLALHCSPPAISSHDTPDNGTFELFAYGRWLMPDTGFYTYGHDLEARAWHRQTRVHPVLTLDGQDSAVDAEQLLWQSGADLDVVAVQNHSYPGLTHRRTLWFVDKTNPGQSFFVLLDEAIGDAPGQLALHFQFAPGELAVDAITGRVRTLFDDANLLLQTAATVPLSLAVEPGWHAWTYGAREPRNAIRLAAQRASGGSGSVAFLTLLVPYRGNAVPSADLSLPGDLAVGQDQVEVAVTAFGRRWRLGRDLQAHRAWCHRG